MSFVFPTNASQVQAFAGALYGVQVGTTTMAQVNADIAANGGLASTLNSYYSATFGGATTASVATTVATNLGLTGDALTSGAAYVEAQLNAAAPAARGQVISSIVNLFANLSADATFGAAATAWNTKVATAAAYTGADNVAIGSVVATSAVFTLTTGVDVADDISASRGNLTSTFKFSTGNETVNASTGTLNDGDILIDASTADADVLNVSGGTGTATVSNIETINLTTAAAAVLQLDNVTGAKNVNITGTNTVTVDGFNAATFQPTFGINNITRVVTIETTTLGGAASTADAETLNLSVSGLSYGTTAAKQSGITLNGIAVDNTTDVDGVYETVNLASTGTTANDFALALDAGESIGTLNITGDQSVQIRAVSSAVSGVTVNGTDNTGTVTLRVDRDGASGATNAANWTGVDNILIVDSAAGTEGAVVSALKSGDTVTIGSTFTGADSSLALQGASFSALKDSINVTLDNVAATAAGVSLSVLDIQNVKTLNLTSAGHASSTSTSGANLLNDLTGDFTTITITGDTSLEADLNINDVQTATSTTTARTVVVNASGMTGTAFVNFGEIAANAKVGYNITGTANGDNVILNNTAGTVAGGAGNDTITGGNGNDTIDGGEGVDTISISYGTDAVTGGAGNDTINVDFVAVASTQEVQELAATAAGTPATAGTYVINILGEDISFTIDNTAILSEFEAAATAAINLSAGALAGNFVAADATNKVTITFAAALGDVAAATIKVFGGTAGSSALIGDATNGLTAALTTATPGVTARNVSTTLTDFAVGDVIDTDTIAALGTGGYYEGASSAMTAGTDYGVIVLTNTSYANSTAAATAINVTSTSGTDAVVIFLNSTTGKAEAYFDDNIGGNDVAGNTFFTFDNITTLTGIASTFSADSFVI